MNLSANMLKCINMMVYTDKQKQEIAGELGSKGGSINAKTKREKVS